MKGFEKIQGVFVMCPEMVSHFFGRVLKEKVKSVFRALSSYIRHH